MANLLIQESPELNFEMEALTTATPAHADRFNERFEQMLNNEKALQRDAKVYEDERDGEKYQVSLKGGLLCISSP